MNQFKSDKQDESHSDAKSCREIGDQQLTEWIESIRTALSGDNLELAWQAIQQFVAKIVVQEKRERIIEGSCFQIYLGLVR